MNLMPDSFLRALGWVLAHSLWQGALIALALLLLLPRLQTARQRYRVAYGALAGVLLAALGTFFWKFEARNDARPADLGIAVEIPDTKGYFIGNQFFETSIGETFTQWLETNHALIVAFWLIGFAFFLLRLGGGLWQVHRLRSSGVNTLESVWQEKILALAGRIGVSRSVALVESAWVNTPLTIGWLKPAILLPIGFVNRLTPAEVEAVLAHELAHIARRDWVFNLLQAFVETIFYYHPAVWWISQVIRRERENACDDAALAATGNPLAFARALVQVQEMATPLPVLALAMSGKRRRPLLERVRRILNQAPQQQHQVMEKITATVILLALLALVGLRANSVPSIEAAFAQIADIPAAIFSGQSEEDQMSGDSLPKPKSTRKITREDDNGRVEAEYKDGKLKRLNIDGKEIPESEYSQHEDLIEELAENLNPPPPPPAPPAFWQGREGHGWAEAPEAPEAPERPEFPEAPGFYRFGTPAPSFAPRPPFPASPFQDGGVSIVTDKDEEGNTILKLDNNGKSTEVVVKNGEVWVDGRKLEKGEPLDIPGLHLDGGGHNFYYGGAESPGNSYGLGNFSWGDGNGFAYGISPEQREQMEEELARAREGHERLMEEYQRNFERDQVRAEKEWKKSQKEWEKQQKDWQKQQKNWDKEQQKWEREQSKWQENQQKWQAEHLAMESRYKAAQERVKKELMRDGLITDSENFSLQLSAKELKVNKKKQSEELRRKYEELLKGSMGKDFEGDNWNYNINYSDDK